LKQVALSGGVFQNRLLLRLTRNILADAGFAVFCHHLVPTNDGGISLGQAVIAHYAE
jgi:hydrogenase maturation protein HypF